MRVDVGRRAVGRPAGVADAGLAGEALGQPGLQVAHPAGLLVHAAVPASGEHGDAGRVVAAVLQPGQALEQERGGLLPADVSDDSAHAGESLR